ncbi:hypothetical protein CONPUDRAFT_157737 [Coniophora puteana RWD-64-598 SS2]|uniref:DUF6533 domain-containing protein n=1 Tax=Coniophora puteana (strain RWD-64-598) TaxID=741705 RepID=A0A5M3MBC9_CONPW|nr:uncharacterized protein CONPUDRAFT_157737 [Coniophora puteana RWD-64-598 SS2]EIW76549.1 hypothetical protein CONPUDRAFT_157737 [Coniophora puteana RWD-64-598 SS2]
MSTASSGDQLLEAELKAELAQNYAIVAMTALVVYDYLLSLGSEIKFVWARKLSFMSIIYGVLRYLGFIWIMSLLVGGLNVPLSNEPEMGCRAPQAPKNRPDRSQELETPGDQPNKQEAQWFESSVRMSFIYFQGRALFAFITLE